MIVRTYREPYPEFSPIIPEVVVRICRWCHRLRSHECVGRKSCALRIINTLLGLTTL